jgi:DNA-directed RNA polymerase subunit E'/Rpb7
MSEVVGSNNSYKPITNTAWVRARIWKLQKKMHSTRSNKIKCPSCLPMVGRSLLVYSITLVIFIRRLVNDNSLKIVDFYWIYWGHQHFGLHTNTAWVRARIWKLQKKMHSTRSNKIKCPSCLPMVGGPLRVNDNSLKIVDFYWIYWGHQHFGLHT